MAKSKTTNTILLALLYIIIGVLFIVFKSSMLNWALTIMGILAIAYGVYCLIQRSIFEGIVYVVLGVVLILGGWVFLEIILIIFGIVLIAKGFMDLITELRKSNKNVFYIIFSVLSIVAGVLLIVKKWVTVDWFFIVIGACLIVDGVLALFRSGSKAPAKTSKKKK